jgi:3D (Asp-Asp-Asp) domain-containing protein
MKKLAGGSLFFLAALIVTLFYFQPKAEAASVLAIDSQETIKQENIQKDKQSNQENIQLTDDQTTDAFTEAKNNAKSGSFNFLGNLSFRATAYCLKGRTASGGSVRRGIVAADTRILPLGTRINIEAGAYSGTYVVADTGGAVRGRILDIWVPSCSEAVKFGRRSVKVSVAGKKSA